MLQIVTASDNFKTTMSGLEKGLHVIHIATSEAQLLCCQHDEDIEGVLARSDLKPFDQIPVKKNGMIIGLLKRYSDRVQDKKSARENMQPLGEEILVSADTSLLALIQSDSLNRIVIDGTGIYGLVTKSDLLKLPVSLLGFALVTHVETLMLTIIRTTGICEHQWLVWLSGKKSPQAKFDRLSREQSELNILEITSFSEKKIILEMLSGIPEYAEYLPKTSLIEDLKKIHTLRNTIAHTGTTSEDNDSLRSFIERLRIAYTWIMDVEKWQITQTHSASSYCADK